MEEADEDGLEEYAGERGVGVEHVLEQAQCMYVCMYVYLCMYRCIYVEYVGGLGGDAALLVYEALSY